MLKHPFYYYNSNPTFCIGFDVIMRATLTIDAESRSVWSKHTLCCHLKAEPRLANSCAKPTIHVNAYPFLETVPPVCLPPSESDDVEDMSENPISDEVLNPLLFS